MNVCAAVPVAAWQGREERLQVRLRGRHSKTLEDRAAISSRATPHVSPPLPSSPHHSAPPPPGHTHTHTRPGHPSHSTARAPPEPQLTNARSTPHATSPPLPPLDCPPIAAATPPAQMASAASAPVDPPAPAIAAPGPDNNALALDASGMTAVGVTAESLMVDKAQIPRYVPLPPHAQTPPGCPGVG